MDSVAFRLDRIKALLPHGSPHIGWNDERRTKTCGPCNLRAPRTDWARIKDSFGPVPISAALSVDLALAAARTLFGLQRG